MSQAIIRGMIDESDEQFVAYFLPTQECAQKRRDDDEQGIDYRSDEEYHYKLIREYTWNIKSKAQKGYEENYYFIIKDDGVYYNQLETRVRLSKRRYKPGKTPNTKSKLVVKYRPLNKQELKQQRLRIKELSNEQDESEDADDEEDEEEEEAQKTRSEQHNESSNDQESSNQNEEEENHQEEDDDNNEERDSEDD